MLPAHGGSQKPSLPQVMQILHRHGGRLVVRALALAKLGHHQLIELLEQRRLQDFVRIEFHYGLLGNSLMGLT